MIFSRNEQKMNVRGLSPLASKQDTLKMKTKHGKMPVIGNARVAGLAREWMDA